MQYPTIVFDNTADNTDTIFALLEDKKIVWRAEKKYYKVYLTIPEILDFQENVKCEVNYHPSNTRSEDDLGFFSCHLHSEQWLKKKKKVVKMGINYLKKEHKFEEIITINI
jgi:hypothetical protein